MKGLLYYLIEVTACSGILYGYYHLFLRNKKFHAYNRFYLLIAATISILIPFLKFPIYFSASQTNSSFVLKTITSIPSGDFAESLSLTVAPLKNKFLNLKTLACCCYILICIIVILRIALSLEKIWRIKKKYPIEKLDTIYFINTNEPGTPFSFFRWLFWDQKIELRSAKGQQVFRHEFFHVKQKHSFDILYMELLSIIFWINPFLYFARKEIKVIHEFLADQFAMNETKNWEYAELLLMQSLNTPYRLSNPFFYNQIKRRIAMITSSQKTSYQYLRKIMVLPVAAVVVALFAFNYKSKKENASFIPLDKTVTVVIDAGHGMDPGGSYTGVTSADGSHEDDIVLSIAKKIKDLNTNDRLQIILTRDNKDAVDIKKRIEFSNSKNADLFISLHTNAASGQQENTKGMDILYSGKDTKHFAENKILATILYNYFYQIHSVNEIKSSKERVYVIDNSNCPSVLIECGYVTDPNDLKFVKDETGQAQIAKSILQSIEQYFLQKGMSDWDEKKRVVSDTTEPLITFGRNAATGKMEGSYNGKKCKKVTDYDGQLVFYFDDSSAMIISKEQTEELKKKYGKSLDEVVTKDQEIQKAEQKGRDEFEKQLKASKEEVELKQLMEKKQLWGEKQQLELKQLMALKKLETEKSQQELKEVMNLKRRSIEGEQLDLKRKMDTLQDNDKEAAMKELKLLMDDKQRETEKMQQELELKQLQLETQTQNAEELKKIMLLMKENQISTEQLNKMLQERKQQLEQKSKTNHKKVKS